MYTCLYAIPSSNANIIYVQEPFFVAFIQPSHLPRRCHLRGSIPSECGWIINAHIQFFTDGEIIGNGFILASKESISCLCVNSICADQDSWYSHNVALTLNWTLKPACVNTYSLIPLTQVLTRSHGYRRRRIVMCNQQAATASLWCLSDTFLLGNGSSLFSIW